MLRPSLSKPRWAGWLPFYIRGRCGRSPNLPRYFPWIERVSEGLSATNIRYPFLAYDTDWLAFAHLVIAVAFIGPYLDPVRNKWIISFGLIACAGVLPLALIAGHFRGIPLPWRFVDCSFGVFGSAPLLLCRRSILALEKQSLSHRRGARRGRHRRQSELIEL